MNNFYKEMINNNPECIFDIEKPSFELLEEAVIGGVSVESISAYYNLDKRSRDRLASIAVLSI